MTKERVLVVDDEQLNLFIIEEFLEQEDVELETHSDPLAAWASLIAPDSNFSLVVLDRMMPELDGMEFLRRMKRETRFADIPVIMQTAASSPDQVREGLEAGAYYYLTKPYEPEALISIVRVAMEDRRARSQLRTRAARLEDAQKLISNVEYRFVTMDDITSLVPVLASMCPVPDVVAPGLSDLMVNAIEHGNLGVTYQEKSSLKWEGDWEGKSTVALRYRSIVIVLRRFAWSEMRVLWCLRFPIKGMDSIGTNSWVLIRTELSIPMAEVSPWPR